MNARSDKLFEKRKLGKLKSDFTPKAALQEPVKKILIVCEDSVTEPAYFKCLAGDLAINIEVHGEECDSPPSAVYKYAKEKFNQSVKAGDEYDHVYCVFDKDTHTSYQPALDAIANQPKKFKGKIRAIHSVPCFEIWILLHFVYTTSHFADADALCKEIRNHLPDYKKINRDVFLNIKDKLPDAIKNAQKLMQENEKTGTDNPATRIHELVEILQEVARSRKHF